jgi:hypothetical protein
MKERLVLVRLDCPDDEDAEITRRRVQNALKVGIGFVSADITGAQSKHKTNMTAQLEIDHLRGVLYVHALEGPLAGRSVLRICRLPAPIPEDTQLDITHMHAASWRGGDDE